MARWIGAAPRQRGSSEACRLRQPSGRRVEDRLRQDHAVGDDHRGIGVVRAKRPPAASGVFRVFGVSTGMPSRRASRSTGVGCSSMPRPAGFGRAGVDRRDLVAMANELEQGRHREIRRAHEDQAKRHAIGQ